MGAMEMKDVQHSCCTPIGLYDYIHVPMIQGKGKNENISL